MTRDPMHGSKPISYISNVRSPSVADLVAGEIQRQQLLVLSCMVAKSQANALSSNISYTIVPQ